MEDPLEESRGFVYSHLPTVDHFRVLLLLQDDPERGWQPSEIAGRLRLLPPVARAALADLHAKGLLEFSDAEDCYRYAPRSAELDGMVRKLADFDRERPVSVIRMIYSRPTEPQAFADAFRLRKPKDPGA
jgi:hypothetical protein